MSVQLRIPGRPTSSEQAKTAVRGESLSSLRAQPDTHLLDAVEVLGALERQPGGSWRQRCSSCA